MMKFAEEGFCKDDQMMGKSRRKIAHQGRICIKNPYPTSQFSHPQPLSDARLTDPAAPRSLGTSNVRSPPFAARIRPPLPRRPHGALCRMEHARAI